MLESWEAILEANNERAPMWLRVNSARETAASYVRQLESVDIEAEEFAGIPGAVRLAQPVAVSGLPGFEAGVASVQDAAAQLAAPWLLDGRRGRAGLFNGLADAYSSGPT